MTDGAPDGSLEDWADIEDDEWRSILIGNGLSINISRYFDYGSLYEEAKPRRRVGGLTDADRAVFEAFGTTNFEVVLARLRDAITLADVLGRKQEPYRRRFRSVQEASVRQYGAYTSSGRTSPTRPSPRSRPSSANTRRSSARVMTC